MFYFQFIQIFGNYRLTYNGTKTQIFQFNERWKGREKRHQITKEDFLLIKAGNDEGKMQQKGKIVKATFDNKESFYPSFKKNLFSPHLIDENQNNSKREFPILELNQLLQKKSSINFQDFIS